MPSPADADPEKGHNPVRRSSDVERPISHDSQDVEDYDEEEEDEDEEVGKKRLRKDRVDDEKNRGRESICENDVVPAATVGEPSGEGIYACDEERCSPCRTRSRASSTRSRPLTIVPRSKRRGLFGRFALVPEVERPYDYKNSTKWTITAAISLATAAAPMGSSIFYRRTEPPLLLLMLTC